jgi:predicted house-cleaning NTP pyrophosphatase (Maf/HAM1 superfamily)
MLISTQPPLLILASASPRRQALLQALGLAVVVVRPLAGRDDSGRPQPVDETPLPHEAPSALVQRLSRLKAATVITQLHALIPDIATGKKAELPDQLVIIAADTEVALAG